MLPEICLGLVIAGITAYAHAVGRLALDGAR